MVKRSFSQSVIFLEQAYHHLRISSPMMTDVCLVGKRISKTNRGRAAFANVAIIAVLLYTGYVHSAKPQEMSRPSRIAIALWAASPLRCDIPDIEPVLRLAGISLKIVPSSSAQNAGCKCSLDLCQIALIFQGGQCPQRNVKQLE